MFFLRKEESPRPMKSCRSSCQKRGRVAESLRGGMAYRLRAPGWPLKFLRVARAGGTRLQVRPGHSTPGAPDAMGDSAQSNQYPTELRRRRPRAVYILIKAALYCPSGVSISTLNYPAAGLVRRDLLLERRRETQNAKVLRITITR